MVARRSICDNPTVADSARSFAGYTLHQRLAVGFYGAVYRAVGDHGREAHILCVDPSLAARDGFVDALHTHGANLGLLEHRHVQQTILIGRMPDGTHAVVNEAVAGAVTLEQLVADADAVGRDMSEALALAVARAVASGLARAHAAGIAHGAVHPRSVLIDVHGGVKVADFAVGRALAEAACAAGDVAALGARGYVAPEVALGDPPSPAADVYAAGALLHRLLSGGPPPGELPCHDAVAAIVARALATDPAERFPTAVELAAALDAAADAPGVAVATIKELARFAVGVRGAAEADLEAETEDVVAAIAGGGAQAAPAGGAASDLDAAVDALVAGLPAAGAAGEDDDPPTAVDPVGQTAADPVSALIRADSGGADPIVRLGATADDEDTYLPPAMTDSDVELAHAARRAIDRAEPRGAPRRPFRPPSGTDPVAPAVDMALSRRRPGALLWVATAALSAAAVYGVLRMGKAGPAPDPTPVVHVVGDEVRAGTIVVRSDEPDAAVWLSLGRTPADSPSLSAAVVHQVRIEHEGFAPADINVVGGMWNGSGANMRAVVSATLQPVPPGTIPEPYPPAPPRPTTGREGRGILHVESRPPGAEAYLLVGFTPEVRLRDVRAGQEYEFKVVKAGFAPAFAVVRADDWSEGGRPVQIVERDVDLVPLPASPPKPRRK
ncbi:MAG: hypothetical protein D6689_20890 [Deltaproteobacteria bacterium]|nr:MAG: hypothetical protein D6689_20890 [Deltaproteobacteria bacterium]